MTVKSDNPVPKWQLAMLLIAIGAALLMLALGYTDGYPY